MQKWEYAVRDIVGDTEDMYLALNEEGWDGWELVTVVPYPLCLRVFLKRVDEENKDG